MNQFKYELLNVEDSRSFKLNEKCEAFLFDTGKSYFKAFEVPRTGYPYYLLIKSYMLGDHIRNAHIFIPYVLTLDEKYHIVRSTIPYNIRLRKAGFMETMKETGGLGRKLEGFIQFTEADKNEKYIIILTTEFLLKEKLLKPYRTNIPVILPGLVTILPGHKELALIPASPMGHLNVSLVSGFPKDFIIIDYREKAFTIFIMIPEEGIEKVKENIKDKKDIDILSLEEFTTNLHNFIESRIIKNEYKDSKIEQIVLNYLYKHPGFPLGVAWNGGLVITKDDAEYAKSMHQLYINNPAEYERSKIQESPNDPLNPQRIIDTHFGPIFEW
ncbi:MAG: MalM family protein [Thermodesulfovibrionales bacterium]|nr:MalM family protein [Thermodesulfovibrionales bacterium]